MGSRKQVTWNDCESIPVEKVAITTAHIAIKKLYKHNSKGKYQLGRSGSPTKKQKCLIINIFELVLYYDFHNEAERVRYIK